jgi:hypothetical protein
MAVAAALGVVVGAFAFGLGGSSAGADVATWTAPTMETGWSDIGSPFQEVEYGTDDEGFVHLRGVLTGDGVEAERMGGGTGGPWVSHAFTLPCESSPSAVVAVGVTANEPVHGLEGYNGIVFILPSGEVNIGGFDIPVIPDSTYDQVMDLTTSLESITYEARTDCTP